MTGLVDAPDPNVRFAGEGFAAVFGNDPGCLGGTALESIDGEHAIGFAFNRDDNVLTFDRIVGHLTDERNAPSFSHRVNSRCSNIEQLGIGAQSVPQANIDFETDDPVIDGSKASHRPTDKQLPSFCSEMARP